MDGEGGLEGAHQAAAVVLEGAQTWSREGRGEQCQRGCCGGRSSRQGWGRGSAGGTLGRPSGLERVELGGSGSGVGSVLASTGCVPGWRASLTSLSSPGHPVTCPTLSHPGLGYLCPWHQPQALSQDSGCLHGGAGDRMGCHLWWPELSGQDWSLAVIWDSLERAFGLFIVKS